MSRKDEYKRARRNLERRIERLEAQGLSYMGDIPKPPKKITKASIDRLNKITRENMIRSGQVASKDTGDVIRLPKDVTLNRYNKARNEFILSHGGETPESFSATYNKETNTFTIPTPKTEEYGDYEQMIHEKLGEISEMIDTINNSVLTLEWENFMNGHSEEVAIDELKNQGIYEKFQEAIQYAYEYTINASHYRNADYKVGVAVTEAVQLLKGSTPLSAQEMQDIANAGYAQ